MCIVTLQPLNGLLAPLFARKVHLSQTRIFARMLEPGRQGLAYAMNLDTRLEVAMVLPLPVAPGAGEDAVRFVDLSDTPRMFEELAALFEEPPLRTLAIGGLARAQTPRPKLVVHDVGAFVASYVPGRSDFDRLDERFRLPAVVFDAVPEYADHGFAVFQLKPGKVTVPPMALTFPTRMPDRLFFPTVHVHDGRFHARARFDHALYYQHPRSEELQRGGDVVGWGNPARGYGGLVDPTRPVVRRTLRGRLRNADTWIGAT
jgi:hypothetical protein